MPIAKNIGFAFATKIICTILKFASGVFLTRLLGAEGKGVFGFLSANISLFIMLFGFSMVHTLTYFVANKKVKNASLSGIALCISLGSVLFFSAIITMLYFTDSSIIYFLLPKGYVSIFILIFIVISFAHKSIVNFFNGIWQGNLDFKKINITLILESVIRLLVFAIVWYYIHQSGKNVSIEYVLQVVIGVIATDTIIRSYIFIKQKHKFNFRLNKSTKILTKSILKFGTIGMASGVINFAIKRIDIWFVEEYNGLEQLGIYLLAVGLLDTIISTLTPALQVLIPYYAKKNKVERIKLLGQVSRINTLFTFLFILMIATLGFHIIPMLYGVEFIGSKLPFLILSFGAFFIMIRNVFSSFNVATNRQHINIKANIIALVITLFLDIILIPNYGIIGACYASIIAYFVSCVFLIYPVLKASNLSFSNFFIIRTTDTLVLYDLISKQIANVKR